MARRSDIAVSFVEFIPEAIDEGVLYVSMEYATASHRCCCGCGLLVVTPLSPTDWRLTFDGRSIYLHPSIGNWSFPCQSHYWVRGNRIQWAGRMSKQEIDLVRAHDKYAKTQYFRDGAASLPDHASKPPVKDTAVPLIRNHLVQDSRGIRAWLSRWFG